VTVPADVALDRALLNHIHIEVSGRSGAASTTPRASARSRPVWHPLSPLRVNAHTRRLIQVAMIDIAIGVYFIVFVASKVLEARSSRGSYTMSWRKDCSPLRTFPNFSMSGHQSEVRRRAAARIARPEYLVR